MKHQFATKLLRLGVLGASLAVTAGTATAADLSIEEVVVTGTKRAEAQQDLGIAITALTENQIKNTFTADVTALSQLAPNVRLDRINGFNAVKGGIRGTAGGNIIVTNDQPVGIAIDDFAINHMQSQFVKLFDIEQIEIFRGPQGTLFGKNTSAGAIAITTKKPVLNEFFGTVEASIGEYSSNSSQATELNFAVNVPLGDTLAMRLALIKDDTDGWVSDSKPSLVPAGTNPLTPKPYFGGVGFTSRNTVPEPSGDDIGGFDVLAMKVKFLWEPNDMYDALLTFEYVDDGSDVPASTNVTPEGEGYVWDLFGFKGNAARGWTDPWASAQSDTQDRVVDFARGHEVNVDGIYLTQNLRLGNYTIKSITGMRDQEEILASCYTAEQMTSLYDASRNSEREMFQQEIRVISDLDGPFNFVAGAAYYEDDVDMIAFAHLGFYEYFAAQSGFNEVTDTQQTQQDRKSTAFYIDGTYDINDTTSVSAGLRRTEDEKDFFRLQFGKNAGDDFFSEAMWQGPHVNPLPESNFNTNVRASEKWSATTWRFVLNHNLNDDVMIYGSASKGFIAGGFAETCGTNVGCAVPYEPEESQSYEIGMKGDFLDGNLRVNIAAFNVTYEDLLRTQVVTVQTPQGDTFQETKVVNNGESEANGVELEVTWLPSDNFRIDFNLGTLDHEFNEYKLVGAGAQAVYGTMGVGAAYAAANPILDLSGLEPTRSPDLNLGLSATYDHDLANGANMTYNFNVAHSSEAEAQPFPANAQGLDSSGNAIIIQKANTQMDEYTVANASMRYTTADDKFAVTLFAKNIFEEKYQVDAAAVATLWVWSNYGPPRFVGLKVDYNF
mgnify:FL=1